MHELIAGVDEAGRGPLAGPVTAAAVILPNNHAISGLADSKKISVKKREALAGIIKQTALSYAVCFISQEEIDRINILEASLKAMAQAIAKLSLRPHTVLVDGNKTPTVQGIRVQAIIKGDSKIDSISAAAILAKVARDERMLEFDKFYPEYGFARHKGYGTKEHIAALARHGVCPIHRKSFAPVRKILDL